MVNRSEAGDAIEAPALEAELDVIAKRLLSSDVGSQDDPIEAQRIAMHWMAGQVQRSRMRRRAWWCVVSAWFVLVIAALASAATAMIMTNNMQLIFGMFPAEAMSFDSSYWEPQPLPGMGALTWMTRMLLGTAIVLLAIGMIVAVRRRMPGLQAILNALDWAAGCDAVARLLGRGCTYSESFSLVAGSVTSPSVRRWFADAQARTDRGQSLFNAASEPESADASILRLVLGASEQNAGNGDGLSELWATAANHFEAVSQRRLGILTHFVPPAATLLSGVLAWLAISSSLGWIWRSLSGAIGGLS